MSGRAGRRYRLRRRRRAERVRLERERIFSIWSGITLEILPYAAAPMRELLQTHPNIVRIVASRYL